MVKSPCIGKCTYDITIMQCNDCGRTKEEISTWYVMTDDEKLAVLERLLREALWNGQAQPFVWLV